MYLSIFLYVNVIIKMWKNKIDLLLQFFCILLIYQLFSRNFFNLLIIIVMWRMLSSLLLFIIMIGLPTVLPFACKSFSGSEVDWFFAYKLPELDSKDPRFTSGTAFLYADSRNSNSWILSNASVAERISAIGQTTSQIFLANRNKSTFFALYNDENPNTGKTDSGRAHMKGVVVSDDITGFWLVHSVPKFPSTIRSGYVYPENGKRNGQSFLCITFPSDQLLEIGKQLFVSQPNFYDVQLPASFERLFPDLANAVNKKTYPKSKPTSFILQLRSLNHNSFVSFSKHKRFDKDLYEELVAPKLRTSLFTETWMVGKGNLSSDCSTNFKVHNIQSIRLPQAPGIAFKNTEDHSKWAVSGGQGNWICIGDINRQQSQAKRGGGTICLANPRIASLYRSTIDQVECCRGESQCRPRLY